MHLACLTLPQELGQFGVFHVLHAFPSPSLLPLPPRPLTHLSHRPHCFRILLCVPSPPKKGEARSRANASNESHSSDSVIITSWSWNRDPARSNFFLSASLLRLIINPRPLDLLWGWLLRATRLLVIEPVRSVKGMD